MSRSAQTYQLSTAAAEAYEEKFVPVLFAEWAQHIVDAAGVRSGQTVLDVACGTGVVARAVADRLGGTGRVVGVDLNEGMLEVARGLRPDIEWHRGDAADLPFPSESFDVVLCQAALMYFPDRVRALREMKRVVTRDGTVAVHVWGSLDRQPAYRAFAQVASRHVGPVAFDVVGSYFSLGDLELVAELFQRAGLDVVAARTRHSLVRFGSLEEFVEGEIEGSPLADLLQGDAYARILDDCREALGEYLAADGSTKIRLEGHLVTARKR